MIPSPFHLASRIVLLTHSARLIGGFDRIYVGSSWPKFSPSKMIPRNEICLFSHYSMSERFNFETIYCKALIIQSDNYGFKILPNFPKE